MNLVHLDELTKKQKKCSRMDLLVAVVKLDVCEGYDGVFVEDVLNSMHYQSGNHQLRVGFEYEVYNKVHIESAAPFRVSLHGALTGSSVSQANRFAIDVFEGASLYIEHLPRYSMKNTVILVTGTQPIRMRFEGALLSNKFRRETTGVTFDVNEVSYEVRDGYVRIHRRHVVEALLESTPLCQDIAKFIIAEYV